MQCILLKSDEFENWYSLLYILLKCWLCCCEASVESVLQDCLSRFSWSRGPEPEQIEALQSLLASVDVLAILPTGFRKSLIYQVFGLAKQSSNQTTSIRVISPLNSIVQKQIRELTKLGLPVVHLKDNDPQCMADITLFSLIFAGS